MILKLGDSTFSAKEISFHIMMERFRLACCKTTSAMHYEQETKQLWHCMYRTAGGVTIRLLSGPKNSGQILSNEVVHSHYYPSLLKVNFSFPCERILSEVANCYPKIIMLGILEPVMGDAAEEALAEGAEFNLGFDVKLLGSVMRKDGFGDVNVMGLEAPATVYGVLEILKHQLEVVAKLQGEVELQDLPLKAVRLQTVLCDSSRRIRRLCSLKRDQEFLCKHLLMLCAKNPDNKG